MARIPNEEFEIYEAAKRHEDLTSALQAIALRPRENLEPLLDGHLTVLEKNLSAIEAVAQKDNMPDLRPLIEALASWRDETQAEMIRALSQRPGSFRIERDNDGLITRIVVE